MTTTKSRAKKAAMPAQAPAVTTASTLQVEDASMKSLKRLRAEAAAEGVVGNAQVMQAFAQKQFGDVDLAEAFSAMRATAGAVHGGDLKPVEAMLMAQASSLNTIFTELARRAGLNLGGSLEACETYLRLALKAQAQCRATLEALVEAKAPRSLVIAKSANVAHNQQINHGSTARTEEPATSPNGLLEAPQHGNFVDPGAAGAAGRDDPVLAPVGALDGTAHR
jgi:hypothetical protein